MKFTPVKIAFDLWVVFIHSFSYSVAKNSVFVCLTCAWGCTCFGRATAFLLYFNSLCLKSVIINRSVSWTSVQPGTQTTTGNFSIYEGRLKSSWTHLISPSWNVVEGRWRSILRIRWVPQAWNWDSLLLMYLTQPVSLNFSQTNLYDPMYWRCLRIRQCLQNRIKMAVANFTNCASECSNKKFWALNCLWRYPVPVTREIK